LTVNSTADTSNPSDSYLSLREAIAIVNSPTLPSGLSAEILGQISGDLHEGGADSILFDPSAVSAPIVLGGTQLELSLPGNTAAVTIDGGDTGVTVDGNDASRVLQVDAGVQASFAHLTITHGRVTGFGIDGAGGGISNSGTLTLTDSTLSANSASSTSNGGGIVNAGTLTVSHSTFSSNSALYGGGIYNSGLGSTLTVSHSTLGSNSASYGGGIFNGSTLTVSHSTLGSNSASQIGGGIYNNFGSTLTVSSSTLSTNSAGAGGGIGNNGGTLTVTSSTFSANSANGDGGGIANISGGLMVTNSTLSANSAGRGGGIYIFGFPGEVVVLQNTLVAGNRSTNGGPDINGPVDSSSSYNLVGIGDSSLSGISNGVDHNQIGTPASPIDPLLAPLGDYGGPTQTMPLLAGSPALNAGDPALLGSADQRGVIRTGGVNIGAFQASASAIVVTAPNTATAGAPFDISMAVLDQFGQTVVGYTGTTHFSSSDSDPNVILPADYTFGPADGGMVTFSGGVTLFTSGSQTVTATDLSSGISGSGSVTL
jgi:CSLREA domain-containing protein